MTTLFEALRAQNHELIKEREAMLAEVEAVRSEPVNLVAAMSAAAIHRCAQADLHNQIGQLEVVISDRDYEIARLKEGHAMVIAEFEAHKEACRDNRDRLARLEVLNEKLVASHIQVNELLDARTRDLDALSESSAKEAYAKLREIDDLRRHASAKEEELNVLKGQTDGRSVESARPKRAKG